jgi:hypothetical protein
VSSSSRRARKLVAGLCSGRRGLDAQAVRIERLSTCQHRPQVASVLAGQCRRGFCQPARSRSTTAHVEILAWRRCAVVRPTSRPGSAACAGRYKESDPSTPGSGSLGHGRMGPRYSCEGGEKQERSESSAEWYPRGLTSMSDSASNPGLPPLRGLREVRAGALRLQQEPDVDVHPHGLDHLELHGSRARATRRPPWRCTCRRRDCRRIGTSPPARSRAAGFGAQVRVVLVERVPGAESMQAADERLQLGAWCIDDDAAPDAGCIGAV